jgi:hypothetical protein
MLSTEVAGLGDVERPASEVEVTQAERRGLRRPHPCVQESEDERVVPAAAGGKPGEDLVALRGRERIRPFPDRPFSPEAEERVGAEELVGDRVAYQSPQARADNVLNGLASEALPEPGATGVPTHAPPPPATRPPDRGGDPWAIPIISSKACPTWFGPREHESHRHLAVDPGAPVVGAVEIGHLVGEPLEIEHPIDPGQDVIVRDELPERARDEELQLIAWLPPQHPATSRAATLQRPSSSSSNAPSFQAVVPEDARDVAAVARTIFAQPDHASAVSLSTRKHPLELLHGTSDPRTPVQGEIDDGAPRLLGRRALPCDPATLVVPVRLVERSAERDDRSAPPDPEPNQGLQRRVRRAGPRTVQDERVEPHRHPAKRQREGELERLRPRLVPFVRQPWAP